MRKKSQFSASMKKYKRLAKRRVLFVCRENSFRSQIAEAFSHVYGRGNIEVYSAGSHPSGIVNPEAIEIMKEVGYDLSTHKSKSLNDIPDIEYDVVITMGCGDECPFVNAKIRKDWNIPDPKGVSKEGLQSIRDIIEARVKELIYEIEGR